MSRLVELGLCTADEAGGDKVSRETVTSGGLSCRVTKLQMPALDEDAADEDADKDTSGQASKEEAKADYAT
jgi:hypothetical protein